MLRNIESAANATPLNVNTSNKHQRPQIEPQTAQEAALIRNEQRQQFEYRVKHHPQDTNLWLRYAKFERGFGTKRAVAVLNRALEVISIGIVDVWMELLDIDQSETTAERAIAKFPLNDRIWRIAVPRTGEKARGLFAELCSRTGSDAAGIDTLGPDAASAANNTNHTTPTALTVKSNNSASPASVANLRAWIEFEKSANNWALVTQLYEHLEEYVSDATFWCEWVDAAKRAAVAADETLTDTSLVFAKGISSLFAEPPSSRVTGRVAFAISFLETQNEQPSELEAVVDSLLESDLSPLERTQLVREKYHYKALQDSLNPALARMLTELTPQRLAHIASAIHGTHGNWIIYNFEKFFAEPPKHTEKTHEWRVYTYVATKYAIEQGSSAVYERLIQLLPFVSAKLVLAYAAHLKKTDVNTSQIFLREQALKSPGKSKLLDAVLDFVSYEEGQELYRQHLSEFATKPTAWVVSADFEHLHGHNEKARALYELALSNFDDLDDREFIYREFTELERVLSINDHKSRWEHVLTRRFFEHKESESFWEDVAKFLDESYGSEVAQSVLEAGRSATAEVVDSDASVPIDDNNCSED